jgi:hypothetical protein
MQRAVKHSRADSKSRTASKPRDGRGLLAFYFVLPPASCVEIDLPPVAATTSPVPFLKCEGCRWPLSDGLFCNAGQVEGKPYCAGHCERAYARESEGSGRPMPVRPRLPCWSMHRVPQRLQDLVAQAARPPKPLAGRVA